MLNVLNLAKSAYLQLNEYPVVHSAKLALLVCILIDTFIKISRQTEYLMPILK